MAKTNESSNTGPTQAIAALLQQLGDGADRASVENEILRISAELEQHLHRRSADLAAASQELDSFSYSVSHDLRAPLSTIDGFSRLLEGALAKGAVERSQHYLQRIRLGVLNLNELLGAVLTVSRLARASISVQAVDLGSLAQQAFAALQEGEPTRSVQVQLQPDLVVRGDLALLHQLVEQLASNAWKFSAKKERAEILVGSQPGEAGETIYFFRDNGAGFDMQHADKLFGIFQRLHVSSEFTGIGAGLSVVQRVVQRHGGRAWAQAAPEQGATIYFTLPGA